MEELNMATVVKSGMKQSVESQTLTIKQLSEKAKALLSSVKCESISDNEIFNTQIATNDFLRSLAKAEKEYRTQMEKIFNS